MIEQGCSNYTMEGKFMETLWMNQLANFREMLKKESAALTALLQLEDDKYEAL